VILYLHGNSSSRLECTSIMQYLPERVGLASFDFLGCRNNHEEDMVTLGIREAEQVNSVVETLRGRGLRVALWGRSMGAATALKFGSAQIIVADSSFRSFRSLCREVLS
jgi:pimeloyl-ACP methyl ester carboxylesterase